MIGKVCRRGADVRRLLFYLFTEGLAGQRGLDSEHTDAHLIAGWDDPRLLEVPARVAMQLLGHSQIGMTMHDTHVVDELAHEAAASLTRALWG